MADAATHGPIEIVNAAHPRGPFRCAVLDFDGTLSLLRADWQGLMTRMMVEILAATGTSEPRSELETLVREFVVRLTGQPTIAQMEALSAEVVRRGHTPRDLLEYLDQYQELLMREAQSRIDAIRAKREPADAHLVPGSRPLLEELKWRGLLLVIASGTELSHVQHEAEILELQPFFGSRIYGPVNNDPKFAKLQVFERLMAEHDLRGSEIIAIGDGPAEMLAARSIGALAIGVASDEVARDGRVNALKREHLLRSGADVVVADYRELATILSLFGMETRPRDGETERRRDSQ
jgi:phosphoglycolate phosphatase-like HAD superfamily hydrolase